MSEEGNNLVHATAETDEPPSSQLGSERAATAPEKCSRCRYWVSHIGYQGLCRRRAPVYETSQHDSLTARFPETDHLSWCGEFEVRNAQGF